MKTHTIDEAFPSFESSVTPRDGPINQMPREVVMDTALIMTALAILLAKSNSATLKDREFIEALYNQLMDRAKEIAADKDSK